jgi:SIR2-like domain
VRDVKLPADLIENFRAGNAAVFSGAGVSIGAGLPSWENFSRTLAGELEEASEIKTEQYSSTLMTSIPQYYENRYGRRRLLQRVESLLTPTSRTGSATHDLLAQLPAKLHYTTNFDELLESSLRKQGRHFDLIVSDHTARVYTERRGLQVRKIHGTLSQPDTLIITRDDYTRFAHENTLTLEVMRADLRQSAFLFIGYSMTDPDFISIYESVLLSMGRMRQTHHFCVTNLSELEAQDLRQRGITPIDLSQWPGSTATERLDNFLRSLIEETSEELHVRRFYGDTSTTDCVPIVVTSRLHENERYVYYPECDLFAAQSVQDALKILGRDSRIVADHNALSTFESFVQQDLVTICSPFGNAFTARIFEEIRALGSTIDFEWVDDGDKRSIRSKRDGGSFVADNPLDANGEATLTDYAVIGRHRNPWSPGHKIYMVAGLNAISTHAAGNYLKTLMTYRELPWSEANFTMLLTIQFNEHDPYNYRYHINSTKVL